MERHQTPLSILSEPDRVLYQAIATSANKSWWRHAVVEGPFLLLLYSFGFALMWIPPYLFPARGIALCQRYGTLWIPMDEALAKFLNAPGALVVFCAVLLTGSFVGRVLRDRRIYRLLSHVVPSSNVV